MVENETGKILKCLISNNGGEYYSKNFDDYCSYDGIHREKTITRKPQENGVSERMNRTIMERARSMIACWFALTVLGRCCRYFCLLNK